MADPTPLIIDNGSYMTKAGFGGDDGPRGVFQTVIGRPRQQGVMVGIGQLGSYVGDQAISKRGTLTLSYPIQQGIVANWDDMTKVWLYTFSNVLKMDPQAHPVLLTEPPLNPKSNREKLTQIMFDIFKVPMMILASQPGLALSASGRSTGVIIDIGDSITRVVPIYEGNPLPQAMTRFEVAGRNITDFLVKLIIDRGYPITTAADHDTVRDIKEKSAFVSQDFDADMATAQSSSVMDKNYELPNGQVITLGNELFRCPEVLFKPGLLGLGFDGLHQAINASIGKCAVNIRGELYNNIIVAGGGSMFAGIADRITKELTAIAPPKTNIKVIAPPERKYSTWIGGSIFGTIYFPQGRCITKADYLKYGPSIVHTKCP